MHLDEDETVVWAGQPVRRLQQRDTWLLLVFGTSMFASAVFMNWSAATSAASPDAELLFALLVTVPVSFVMIYKALHLFGLSTRTVYAITDKRALSLVQRGRAQVDTFALKTLGHIEELVRADGTGDVVLRSAAGESENFREFRFAHVADVAAVARTLRNAREALSPTR